MPSPSSVPSAKRRLIVVGLGTGILATVAIRLGWRSAKPQSLASAHAPVPTPEAIHANLVSTSTPPAPAPSAPLTREWFLPHLHSKFDMDMENVGHLPLELVAVSAATTETDRKHNVNYDSFSLLFRGAKDMPEESKVFQMKHEALGSFELFLSPVGHFKDRVEYEAIFSRKV